MFSTFGTITSRWSTFGVFSGSRPFGFRGQRAAGVQQRQGHGCCAKGGDEVAAREAVGGDIRVERERSVWLFHDPTLSLHKSEISCAPVADRCAERAKRASAFHFKVDVCERDAGASSASTAMTSAARLVCLKPVTVSNASNESDWRASG